MSNLSTCSLYRMLGVFCFLVLGSVLTIGRESGAVINVEQDDEIRQLVSKLESGSTRERRDAILFLHRFGKDAIPLLIENISNGKEIYGLLSNPTNSNLGLAIKAKTYAGTISSYAIELILRREEIKEDKNGESPFFLGDSDENYLFPEGVIKKNNGLAKKSDLLRIKMLYQKWWEKNRSETIEKLREKQKSGEQILNRRPYYWE